MTAGETIRQYRVRKGWSQEDLAGKAGIREATVSEVERNERKMRLSTAIAIAKALEIPITELFRDFDASFPVMLDAGAYMPERAHEDDAGFDLRSPKPDFLPARGSVVIDTGVHIKIPKGYAGMICSKSGLNIKHGIISDGLVDAGYTGSIRVKLYNLSDESYVVYTGDKISQIVFVPIAEPNLEVVDALDETERGDNGFGSTGR